MVVLELGLRRGERRLPLCRCGLHRGQVLMSLLQRLECVPHHVDRGDALRHLCALVQKLVSHSLKLVLQPPVVGP
jgi:hypothetical protein